MSNEKPESQGTTKVKDPLLLTAISGLSFLLLLLLMFYIGESFETLEEQLRFQAPVTGQETGGAAYGIEIIDSQTVYVPVYSHIYSRGGEAFLLETTLSIRNSDPDHAITVQSVRYYDTKGKLVQDYLNTALPLGPLETTEFLVEKRDTRGGSGANFIVTWNASEAVYEPIIEAVMVGVTQDHSLSLLSPGRPLVQRKQ